MRQHLQGPRQCMSSLHKNQGKKPSHSLSEVQVDRVVNFMLEVAAVDGIPNPRFTFEYEPEEGELPEYANPPSLVPCSLPPVRIFNMGR